MNSDELKQRNAKYRQHLIDSVRAGDTNQILVALLFAVVEVGSSIAEQMAELRETIARSKL